MMFCAIKTLFHDFKGHHNRNVNQTTVINTGIKTSKVNAQTKCQRLQSGYVAGASACRGGHSLLVTRGFSGALAALAKPPSKAAFSTSSRFPAVTRSSWERTLAGMSSRSFSLRLGRMTRFTPALWAARTLSLMPPTCGSKQSNTHGMWHGIGWHWPRPPNCFYSVKCELFLTVLFTLS